ncbi:hypothetical protein [Paraburkholderia tropica]|uniref:hypothetical protein n=1 Tax=Paraburkholderia tropica TaxID=92647 RepID=UPI003D296EDD
MPYQPPVRSVEIITECTCRHCGLTLPVDRFYRDSRRAPWTRSAYSPCCRACTRALARASYAQDIDRSRATVRRRYYRAKGYTSGDRSQARMASLRRYATLPATFERQKRKRQYPRPRLTFAEIIRPKLQAAEARRRERQFERRMRNEELQHAEEQRYADRLAAVLGGRDPETLSAADCLAVLIELQSSR